jgi:hypothetical protein
MERLGFVTPIPGLNRPNTGKEEEDDDDDNDVLISSSMVPKVRQI